MKKILFFALSTYILILAGCSSNHPKPKTIPLELIKSEGSLVDKKFNKTTLERLEKTLDEIVIKTGTKGISASVAVVDKGIWQSSRGITGNKSIKKINPDMKFLAGSIGKIFTTVVILNLVDEGRLSLESTIDKWVPDFMHGGKITINHLLTHTSGIISFDNLKGNEKNRLRYQTPGELFLSIKNRKLLFEPGKHYSYSNSGYLILGLIIEKITGNSYKEAIHKYIIDKITLKQTEVLPLQKNSDLIVRGHNNGKVILETKHFTNPFAAGNIVASSKDLIIFFQKLMSGKLLSEKYIQKMFSNLNHTSRNPNFYYGKGISVALNTPVGDIMGHTGGGAGFRAALYYHPGKNIFVSVMMNDDIKSVEPAMFRLIEVICRKR